MRFAATSHRSHQHDGDSECRAADHPVGSGLGPAEQHQPRDGAVQKKEHSDQDDGKACDKDAKALH